MKCKKRILITGINGFIGSAFWQYFQKNQKHFELFGLDLKAKPLSGRVWRCHLDSSRKIKSILQKVRPHYVLHFIGGRSKSQKDQVRLNCHPTQCLFDAVGAIRDFSPRIIIPGSAAEYGIPPKGRRLVRENDALNSITSYGDAKCRQVQMALKYAQQDFDVVVARIFNILGVGTPSTLAVGNFARQIAAIEQGQQKPIIETEPLVGGRDFLDIEDVCRAIVCLMQHGKSGQVYNVCSGKKVVMKELLYKLIALSWTKNIAVKEKVNKHLVPFDVIGSNAKMKSLNCWQSRISFQRSLKKTLESYRAMSLNAN